jgi:hypothetical protein
MFFNKIDVFAALRSTGNRVLPAARHMLIIFGMKEVLTFAHRSQEVLSLNTYISTY